ncbi:MAG TPA: hypothetical protein VIJ79_05410 [Acidobacteriaceae bacterium]
MRIKPLRASLCAASIALALTFFAGTQAKAQQPAVSYNSTFSIAEQSLDSKGRTVIVMQGTGDLPGVLTLVLSLAADGTISGGEWALNVSYTAPLHPDAAPDPNSPDPDSAQGEQLIQKGVLSGTIGSGSTTAANGVVSAINSLQLVLTHGTLQFAAVTQGSGSVVGAHIDDRANSNAHTSLTF